jgi:hypothetical protein
MPYQEFKDNLRAFSDLIDNIPTLDNEQLSHLIKSYAEQNILIMNDIFNASIENLKRLHQAKTSEDIICTQARFTNEIRKKLSLSTQRFLNASLGHIADYNEWLKAHCDLATD